MSLTGDNNSDEKLSKKIVIEFLRQFNLTVIRAPKNTLSGIHFFDDSVLIINKDSPVCLDVGANAGQTIKLLQMELRQSVKHIRLDIWHLANNIPFST